MKNILGKLIVFLLSLFASWALLYFVISEFILRFTQSSNILNFIIMIFAAFLFYSFAISIINKKFDKFYIDIIAILYFLLVIGITFFKSSYSYSPINLNPLSIINDFGEYFHHTLLVLISNIFIYIPLGIYVRYKTNIRIIKLLFDFLIYIVLIEFTQHITYTGIFDINDIITNTFGFLIGILGTNIYRKSYDQSINGSVKK